jgi:hypothetical protein
MKRLLILAGLLIALAAPFCQATSTEENNLVEQAIFKYEQLDKRNKYNEAHGLKNLNEYVIELDPEWILDPNWIEEKGTGQFKLISDRYERLSKLMKDFNDARADDLRFYIITVNDYKVQLDETVDMKMLPSTIDNLGSYAALPNTQEDYKRYRDEIASIPANISTALEKAKYTNRIIYFYGLIRLYKLDQKGKYYRHDNLSILGEGIKLFDKQLRDAAKKTVAVGDTEGAKIESVANSIIEAIKLVIDKGDESQSLVNCGSSVSEMVTVTATLKEQHYASAVTATADLLDKPTGAQMIGSRYMVVDDPKEFASDDLFTNTILPDKLSLLANNNSKYKVYAVFKQIDFVLPTGEWKNFADAVAQKSTVAAGSNAIVIIIPYYKTNCIAKGWLFSTSKMTGLLMPGVYCADAGMKASMTAALAGTGKTWETNFNQAFASIPKNYTAYHYKFLWNGHLIYDGKETRKDIPGHSELVEVQLWIDERFHQLEKAHRDFVMCGVGNSGGGYPVPAGTIVPTNVEVSMACLDALRTTETTVTNAAPNFKAVPKTNLVQSKLTADIAREFALWYALRKNWGVVATFTAPQSEIFYGGKNPADVEDVLTLIDIASAAASLVGADAIFDGAGAYYAYANGEYKLASFYTAAAAVPFLSSGVRRAVVNGGEYVLKTMKGSFVTRPKNVLGMNYLFEVNSYFSQFTIRALNLKSFNKAAKYKTQKKFVEALEEGMLADNNAIKALNDNPDLVDEFNTFFNEGKGGLREFLAAKKVGPDASEFFVRKLGQEAGDALEFIVKGKITDSNQLAKFMRDVDASDELLEAVSKNPDLIDAWKKVDRSNLSSRTSEVNLLNDVDNFTTNFKQPTGAKRIPADADPPYKFRTSNGYEVEFDADGFPDFKKYCPGKDYSYKASNLVGNSTNDDFVAANAAMRKKYPGKIRNTNGGNFEMEINGEWKKYTWHHHQDGQTLMPVQFDVHSKTLPHTGGASIIRNNLQGMFSSPF